MRRSYILTMAVLALCATAASQQAQVRDDRKIDLYIGDWRESMPRSTHGGLVERAILTRGDPLNPTRKAAVLAFVNRFAYATLAPQGATTPTKLQGEQEIFYFLSGKGTMAAGGETVDLYEGIGILVPAQLEFTIKNTGDRDLTTYLVNEPIPAGFRPNPKLLVRDENTLPVSSTTGHWCHIVKQLFSVKDGLGTMESIITVALDPMTIAEPHAHVPGTEEVWTAIKGESLAFIGTQIRRQGPGVGYLAPPAKDTDTKKNVASGLAFPHANINYGREQIKMFYFARYGDHEVRK